MISYTHPARPAGQHAACHTWDGRGHQCRAHACGTATVVLTDVHGRTVVSRDGAADIVTVPARPTGAHRAPGVSLVKAYV